MDKKIDIEKVIESGTYQERMEALSLYYAYQNCGEKKTPPFSSTAAERLRKAVIQDLKEGNYEQEGFYFKSKEPLSPEEQQQAVENFIRWEILIELATDYATNIKARVERYRADLFSLKALLEEYHALSAIQTLANALLQEGVKPEDMESILLEGLQFEEDSTPYELKQAADGSIVAYLVTMGEEIVGVRSYKGIEQIEKEIKQIAADTKRNLSGYKVAAEAFFNYAGKIGYKSYMKASHLFIVAFAKMVTGVTDAKINGAYIQGRKAKKSPIPALITEYYDLKVSEKLQADNNKYIEKAVEEIWKSRRNQIARSLR